MSYYNQPYMDDDWARPADIKSATKYKNGMPNAKSTTKLKNGASDIKMASNFKNGTSDLFTRGLG